MSATSPPRLRAHRIFKSFPGVRALRGVTLEVGAGEIHAVVGENGAGKSTLMGIIAGVYQPDAGWIELDGQRVLISSESSASALGIALVHQDPTLVPRLSVAENVFGGWPPLGRLGLLDRRGMRRKASEILCRLGVDLDPDRLASTLSPAQHQMVEIAKALARPLRVLILDEPTASLSLGESAHLFRVVRQLAAEGVGIVYVSHRLPEVFELASRVTVLKDGEVTGVRETAQVTVDDLIQLMVGRELSLAPDPRRASAEAPVVLEVRDLHADPVHVTSLQVRAGEIVCLAGLVGAGRTELCEAIFGARQVQGGEILLGGRRLRARRPTDAIRAGIAMVPEDRKSSGLFLEMDVTHNIAAASLRALSKVGFLRLKQMAEIARSFVESLRIKTTSLEQRVLLLSGGNQQKVLLARWLVRPPRLLIVDEPTRGVDVGTKAELYRILRELAAAGTALLVVSSDLPEVLAIAHRIVVMCEGRVVGELDAANADEMAVLRLASPTTRSAGQEVA